MAKIIAEAETAGSILALPEGLSFWGGVDPATGVVIDAHHPACGQSLSGKLVMMPTSRGSCSGSAVLLELALNGNAPAALIFREAEDVLTLGALLAGRMFNRPLAVLRLEPDEYNALAALSEACITPTHLEAEGLALPLEPINIEQVDLSINDRAMLEGRDGDVLQLAMQTICTMAASQGATALTDVTRAHIDGCVYASPANLRFAQTMADKGAKVCIPTTMNAISVDHTNWRTQGVPPIFGQPAQQLADAYIQMGARPSFTCAPYLLMDPPKQGEMIGWSESNAVVFANSVLGARTVKHPDFLDLCIALTGRAPLSGVYLDSHRAARRIIEIDLPESHDDSLWPMLGWMAGRLSPDRIPLLRGLEKTSPNEDDLKALCAAFGTTSAAPMLHVAGVTPEADGSVAPEADTVRAGRAELAEVWQGFNARGGAIDVIAFGSPHLSHDECRSLAAAMGGRRRHADTQVIVTVGQNVLDAARADGTLSALEASGVQVIPDICWCTISEPVFPPEAKTVMTNSGKYAHYGPGLSGREIRFGSLADCVEAAFTGQCPSILPSWLSSTKPGGST